MDRIYIDFDGVIVDTIEKIVSLYNEDFKFYKNFEPASWMDVNSWNFEELSLASPEYINMYFNIPRFFQGLRLMDNAYEALKKISEKYDIVIVSAGTYSNLELKKLWIHKHLPFVAEFIGVDINTYYDKSHIDMEGSIFIDDSYSNLVSSTADEDICFGDIYNWNKEWTGTRIMNWYDVIRYLKIR